MVKLWKGERFCEQISSSKEESFQREEIEQKVNNRMNEEEEVKYKVNSNLNAIKFFSSSSITGLKLD